MADNPKTSTKTIQKVLGHSESRTTEIYLHEFDGAVEKAMDDLSGKFAFEVVKNKKGFDVKSKPLYLLVGARGFEPPTSCSQNSLPLILQFCKLLKSNGFNKLAF